MKIVVDGRAIELSSGKDALINGMNTVQIKGGNNITISQDGNILTISGADVDMSWGNISNKPDVALKSDITNVYKYRGSVATYQDLPLVNQEAIPDVISESEEIEEEPGIDIETPELEIGDVYNVDDTGMNYAWTGAVWDALGMTVDIEAISDAEIDALFS